MKLRYFCLTRAMLCLSTWLEVGRPASLLYKYRDKREVYSCILKGEVAYLLPVFYCPDYVQVVDMGTLELRITAVKPSTDGERVRNGFLSWHRNAADQMF